MRDRANVLIIELGQSILQDVYDSVIAVLFEAVEEAQEKLENGEEKKQYVIEKIVNEVDINSRFGWLKRIVINFFLSLLIDAVIKLIKDELGSDWLERIDNNLRDKLEYIN